MCGGGVDNGFMLAEGKYEKLSANTIGAGTQLKRDFLKTP